MADLSLPFEPMNDIGDNVNDFLFNLFIAIKTIQEINRDDMDFKSMDRYSLLRFDVQSPFFLSVHIHELVTTRLLWLVRCRQGCPNTTQPLCSHPENIFIILAGHIFIRQRERGGGPGPYSSV